MEISRRNLLRMAVVRSGILIGYGLALHASIMIEEMIAKISLAVKPDLIIMDGTKSMIAGGPAEGKVTETNLIIAGGDAIANDVVGLSIVRGYGIWDRVSGGTSGCSGRLDGRWSLE